MLNRSIRFGRVGIGSMFIYDVPTLQTIDAANQYHAAIGYGVGSVSNGTTFKASLTGAITNTANNGGVLRCTDATHGLDTGDHVTLTGMGDAAHVGSTAVTVIDTNTFDCDDISYNSVSDTGNWQRGSALIIDSGYQGTYKVAYSASWTCSGNLKVYKLEMVKNAGSLDEIVTERKIGTGGDLGSSAASGFVELVAGDRIWLKGECVTDATNYTLEHSNVNIFKVL